MTAYRDALKSEAEQIVFVSNDTDLEPALKALREDMGDTIIIGIVIPIRANSRRPPNQKLSKYADWTRSYITDEELANSQLPDKIPTSKSQF